MRRERTGRTDDFFRYKLTREKRCRDLLPSIDPGFVNRRLAQTILGRTGMEKINEEIQRLPDAPDWQREIWIDHLYSDLLLVYCRTHGVLPLQAILTERRGRLFCSPELFGPCPEVYDSVRVVGERVPRGGDQALKAEFHYSTKWIHSDTLRSKLRGGGEIAVVGEIHEVREERIILHPVVMGALWLRSTNPEWEQEALWWRRDFYENYVEDIDEFSKVLECPLPASHTQMKAITEAAFKECLCEILGDQPARDWGGERSDHFSSHIHLGGRRLSAAFLLKGRSAYRPMRLRHLGKNQDQIIRLATEPADLLVIQHCHEILPEVKETLRAFAVQPSRARRFCLIDGRDSLRLLVAYGLLDRALQLSSG